jgi:hypothetical protein
VWIEIDLPYSIFINEEAKENAILIPGAYAPFTWKTNFRILIPDVYLHILYPHTLFVKTDIFWGCAKKDNNKEHVMKMLILVENFIIFT